MSGTLQLFEDLALPLDAATQTLAFIGRKGSGKTYGAGKFAELLLDAGVQVVVLDTVGNWYGLRLAADGKGPGFDIPVLGGLRGDVPLTATAGEPVADLVVETGRSLVIDVSQWSKADRQRFAVAFAERLWLKKKAEADPAPVHLVLEEAQLIIPQMVRGDAARMVGIWEEIVRLGRNYGIGVSLLSQRPQSVNKEALTQTECLVVLQVNGTPERKALREWIVEQGLEVNLLTELPGLPIGTAYVWSPQWLRHLGKHTVARKRTFDASATPKVGERRARGELAPIDLEALKARLAAEIERAQRDDPRALRARIATLERHLAERPHAEPERIVVPAVSDRDLERLEGLAERLDTAARALAEIADVAPSLIALGSAIGGAVRALRGEPVPTPAPIHAARNSHAPMPTQAAVAVATREPQTPPRREQASAAPNLKAGERKMLGILAIFDGRHDLSRPQLAVLSGFTVGGGTFQRYLSTLKSAGLVGDAGGLRITPSGRAYVGDVQALARLTTDDLLDLWRRNLKAGERAMLDELVRTYPGSLGREELGERAGYAASGGTFQRYLSTLRSAALIEVLSGGELRASDTLFLGEGRA